MSLAQENGKLAAELKTAQLQIEQLESGATASQTTIATQATQIAEQAAAIDGHAAAMESAHAELTGQLATATASVATLTAKNADMKTKLENPAFKAASIEGEDPDAAGGGGAGTEQAGSLMEQYKAIKDPAAKAEFFDANKAELFKAGQV